MLEAFQRYDNGDKMVEIVNFLNDKGVRNMLGGKMTHSSVNTMLKNRRYIGELSFRDIVVPDAIPVIVPKDLFDRVQKRLDKNKRAPACGKADEEYLLTTKLFCGKCGALMFGESGTSATGRTYYYYKCANVKRRKGCNKKTVQKDWLEDLVVRETMKLIQDDAVIDKIVQLVMDVQNQENTTIPLLEKQLREVNKKLDNLMKAIEDGLYTRTTKERLEALENQKDELTAKIADEKLKKPSFNEDFIRFWLLKFRKFDISQKKQRKALIEIFVNAIFLYDDRMLITFNYKDGTKTVRFEDTLTADSAEEKSSDLSSSAGPKALSIRRESFFVCVLVKMEQQGRWSMTTGPAAFTAPLFCTRAARHGGGGVGGVEQLLQHAAGGNGQGETDQFPGQWPVEHVHGGCGLHGDSSLKKRRHYCSTCCRMRKANLSNAIHAKTE